MDKLSPYAEKAPRSEKIQNAFNNFFDEIENLKKEIDNNAPKVLTISGSQPRFPAAKVEKWQKDK